eukprot:4488420-Amphidinium_carterae.1
MLLQIKAVHGAGPEVCSDFTRAWEQWIASDLAEHPLQGWLMRGALKTRHQDFNTALREKWVRVNRSGRDCCICGGLHGISLGPTWALLGCFRPLLANEPGWKWLQQSKYENATVMTLMGETESNTSMHRLGKLARLIVRCRLNCRHAKNSDESSSIQLSARQLELQQL